MKMNIFWGIILVLLGVSLILKAVFHIHLPLVRIAFAILIIWWGVKMLFGNFGSESDDNNVIFQNEKIMTDDGDADYNVIFGTGIVDLRSINLADGSKTVKVSAVFGGARILTNPETPMITNISVAFGEGRTPEGMVSFLGDRKYANSAYVKGENVLRLKADAVFGSIRVEN
ncbi:MAG: hypothetical protein R6U84_02365 [Candidatus Cloacimonadales bacterium]